MSSFSIKVFAAITMLIDHIGFALFPDIIILRIIGRISFPLFAFQVAVGFDKTSSRENYILRMLTFAVISQIPFQLMNSAGNIPIKLNIGFTFLISLLLLYSLENVKPIFGKIVCSLPIILMAYFLEYDYHLYGIILVLLFYYSRRKPEIMPWLMFIIVSAYSIYKNNSIAPYALLSIIPILLYNGKKGLDLKWWFYAFYPVHMLALYVITILR